MESEANLYISLNNRHQSVWFIDVVTHLWVEREEKWLESEESRHRKPGRQIKRRRRSLHPLDAP